MKSWIKWLLWGAVIGFILSVLIFYLTIPLWGYRLAFCGFSSTPLAISACTQKIWTTSILFFIVAPTILIAIICAVIGFFKNRNSNEKP